MERKKDLVFLRLAYFVFLKIFEIMGRYVVGQKFVRRKIIACGNVYNLAGCQHFSTNWAKLCHIFEKFSKTKCGNVDNSVH